MDRSSVGSTLRVLLVSAVETVRSEVEAILRGWSGEVRLYWVSQTNLVAARAQDLVPHVVLVDSELDGADPIRLVR
ncbi:MAG: hypothetical protein GX657_09495, partial [Chloroflexi bacterium]|nr:hypothetical protein [Chloroflexota bacterium]